MMVRERSKLSVKVSLFYRDIMNTCRDSFSCLTVRTWLPCQAVAIVARVIRQSILSLWFKVS